METRESFLFVLFFFFFFFETLIMSDGAEKDSSLFSLAFALSVQCRSSWAKISSTLNERST
jgi:hypothetical protein